MGAKRTGSWTYTVPVGAGLVDLYQSLGDVTITSSNNAVQTELNGPIQFLKYDALTLNAILHPTNPCRGLIASCNTLNVGAAGGMSMDGMGAVGSPSWPLYDLSIPASVTLTGKTVSIHEYLARLKSRGWFIGDQVLIQQGRAELGDVLGTIAPGTVLLPASGCGAGASGGMAAAAANAAEDVYANGAPGVAGAAAPGGGGGGGAFAAKQQNYVLAAAGGRGQPGRPWSGGDAGLGNTVAGTVGTAGYPFGGINARPGGTAIILVKNSMTLANGYTFSAKGNDPVAIYHGSPGGGFVGVLCGGSVTIGGVLSAVSAVVANVAAGTPMAFGGRGGDGAVVRKTLAELGL